jgi:ferredoxin-NADP reductase
MSIITNATVQSIESYGSNVKRYTLKVNELGTYESGQFLQLTLEYFNGSGNWPESRAFSIANFRNSQNEIELIIKKSGFYTQRIFNELKEGVSCTIKYAYGDFLLPLFDPEARIHAIAGGTGVAPFLSFVQQLHAESSTDNFHLYYTVSFANEFVKLKMLESLLPKANLHLFCTRENINYALNKRVEISDVLHNLEHIKKDYFYLCGSNSLVETFKKGLTQLDANNIFFEDWN